MAAEEDISALHWNLVLFTLLSIFQIACFYYFVIFLYRFCILPAASKLHVNLVEGFLHKPMGFVQTVSRGEILNLFTNDIGRIDGSLNGCLISLVAQYANFALVCCVLVGTLPASIIFVIPLVFLCIHLQQVYLEKLRELRHFDVASRSSLLTFLQEAENCRILFQTHGLDSTRLKEFQKKLESNLCALFPLSCIDLWLGIRLKLISIMFQLLALGTINIAKLTPQIEADAVSLTRINQYSQAINEDKRLLSSTEISAPQAIQTCPLLGKVEYKSVSTTHRPTLPLSLDSASFDVKPGEKIAVVGRSGAGKSSAISCLLRMIGRTAGQVLIDDVDIAAIDPVELCRRIALIPQQPVIFSSSLRQNIDPFGLKDDEEIMTALETSGALPIVRKLAKGNGTRDGVSQSVLEISVDSKTRLSTGKIQLLALTRAIFQNSQLLVMDEATSGIDASTESIIHETLFEKFHDTTIISVMHKLDLTLHYYKILVLGQGRVSAFDTPIALFTRSEGLYHSMLKDAGLVERARAVCQNS
ncbi:P-loop containing nucleoside triphosphate hydrolase protein [Ilyonectria destructans]|nr:P-loop containing nucleoside triphosphate hydrolase protein [Ilyonectria destructans]